MPTNSIADRRDCEPARLEGAQSLPPGVVPGHDVVVRGRRCRLEAIDRHGDCCELHLARHGRGRQVLLWPFDRPVRADVARRTRVVRLRTWVRALGRLIASETAPLTPRATPCVVDVVPYQLSAALAMASGSPRILLADEVGLGKTIQAGWILSDLLNRHRGARAMVAVPSAVRRQWIDELSKRFGIVGASVDARWLRARVADLPVDISPWTAPGVYVASFDFLKRPDVAASAGRHVWDLLVIDEAHTAAAPTERYEALAAIARRSRRILAATATPYSGNRVGFASMASLGSAGDAAPPIMFRRFREDVGDPRCRRHRFATVRITRAERRFQRLLERYSRDVWNGAGGADARLAVTFLRKRALSSTRAAARSLRRRLDLLSSRSAAPRQLALFDEDDGIADDEQPAALAVPGLADAGLEERWLRALIEAADAAAVSDSKLLFLVRLLRRIQGESAVVFTEYRDTLLHLAAALPGALQMHGGLTSGERARVQERFNRAGGLLLATDAAAEGLNLHGCCRFVANFELPWNPARLEQRIGRVDRIGQRRTVHAMTLTARDTAEDLVIKNIVRRLARVVAALGRGDRLAAYLTETQMAAAVISGVQAGVADEDEGDRLVERAPSPGQAEIDAAESIRRSTAAISGSPDGHDRAILVGSIRASAGIPPGVVVVLRCTAGTDEGDVVARRLIAVHAACSPRKPPGAAAARDLAEAALGCVAGPALIDAGIDSWFAGASEAHRAATDRWIRREEGLREPAGRRTAVQPGLFDRRALLAADKDVECDAALAAEHQHRIDALERSRALSLTCEPCLSLIAWR